jgi:hypothetical protein
MLVLAFSKILQEKGGVMGKTKSGFVVAELKEFFGQTGKQGRVISHYRKEEFVSRDVESGRINRLRLEMGISYVGLFQSGKFIRVIIG